MTVVPTPPLGNSAPPAKGLPFQGAAPPFGKSAPPKPAGKGKKVVVKKFVAGATSAAMMQQPPMQMGKK